jgi:hypothetical protein
MSLKSYGWITLCISLIVTPVHTLNLGLSQTCYILVWIFNARYLHIMTVHFPGFVKWHLKQDGFQESFIFICSPQYINHKAISCMFVSQFNAFRNCSLYEWNLNHMHRVLCTMAFNVHKSRIFARPSDLYGLTSYYFKLEELLDKSVCINKILYPLHYTLLLPLKLHITATP